MIKNKSGNRKGQLSIGILATVIGIGAVAFLGFQLISALAVVGNYASVAGALALGIAIVYFGFTEDIVEDFFSSRDIELLFLVLMGVGVVPLAYVLFERLLVVAGSSIGALIIGLVTLAVYFSPAFVLGGISTLLGFVIDLLDLFGGED